MLVKELQLVSSQKFWLKGRNSLVGQIHDFLAAEVFSDEAKAFAKEAIEVIIDGGEADFENEIILHPTFKDNNKVYSIYNDLTNLSNTIFTDILEDTFQGSKNVKLMFDVGDIPDSQSYVYKAKTYASYNGTGPRYFRVRLKDDFVSQRSDMEIAFSLIHEIVHAELLERCIQSGLILNINTNDNYTFQNYGNPSTFNNLTIFNSLVTYYKTLGNGNPQWNHDLFNVFDLRQSIEDNLNSIDPWLDQDDSFTSIILNDGVFSDKREFFYYLSWAGLEGTQAYQNLDTLEQSKVQYSIQLVNNY